MSIRPPLQVDGRYTLIAALLAFVFAAVVVTVAVVFASSLDDGTPPPTSWHTGDGDTVVITPRAAP